MNKTSNVVICVALAAIVFLAPASRTRAAAPSDRSRLESEIMKVLPESVKSGGEKADRVAWDHRRIIHISEDKAHVDTMFTRYRADGTKLSFAESLYIVTKENGRWGIKMRSSFAE